MTDTAPTTTAPEVASPPAAAPPPPPEFADRLRILPWPDPVIDRRGYDPRSEYAEWFWLSIVGPSTVWLLRRFAATFDHHPDGFDLEVAECAAALGLTGGSGQHATFLRTLRRACQFQLAQRVDAGNVRVRRNVPPLNRNQVLRLPSALRVAHDDWVQHELAQHLAEQHRAEHAGAAEAG